MTGTNSQHRLRDAAIQAEYASGEHEATEQQARSHLVVRLARVTVGVIVVIAGVIMLPLPGPGGLVIAGGLVILARDVAWADRALRYLRKNMPGIPEHGRIPRSTIITAVTLGAAGIAIALWFAVG